MVTLTIDCRVRELNRGLTRLLSRLERGSIREASRRSTPTLAETLAELGIAHARQGATSFPGSVYFTLELPLERSGAWIPDHSNDVAGWITEVVTTSALERKRRKLAASGLDRRHLFLLLPGFTTAPAIVTHTLMRDDPPLPVHAPELPAEVTAVWLASTWSSSVGLRWSPDDGWERFDKLQPNSDRKDDAS